MVGLSPLCRRYAELTRDADELEAFLADGAERARAIAAPLVARAKQALGVG